MATVTQDDVVSVLKRIAAPDGRGTVVSAGLISGIAIQGGTVMFALTTAPQHARTMENLRGAIEKAVLAIPGVEKAMVALTAERDAELTVIGEEITQSRAGRSAIAERVPADLLALYEKQRSRYGTGASLLQHGVSKASGVKLLENEMQAIRSAAPDDVIMCASSEGILVRTEESGI